jgi:hypothetical protein
VRFSLDGTHALALFEDAAPDLVPLVNVLEHLASPFADVMLRVLPEGDKRSLRRWAGRLAGDR